MGQGKKPTNRPPFYKSKKLRNPQQDGYTTKIQAMETDTIKHRKYKLNNKSKIKDEHWKLATWNVRGLNGKEVELNEEFTAAKLDILAVVETKKKGQGELQLDRGNLLIYGGVPKEKRAEAGVGCLLKKKWINRLKNIKFINERLLMLELMEGNTKLSIIIAYGPNENDKTEIKDKFWAELSTEVECSTGEVFVIGDLNGRVGRKDQKSQEAIGMHGEDTKNNNGERLIQFCIENQLIICNTFFEHKNIHKFTREVKSRGEKSIIDYVIVEKSKRNKIKDVKVSRGAELYSDHYLVVAKVKHVQSAQTLREENDNKAKKYLALRTYQLKEEDVANRYRELTECKFEQNISRIQNYNLEQSWQMFKDIITTSAQTACGSK